MNKLILSALALAFSSTCVAGDTDAVIEKVFSAKVINSVQSALPGYTAYLVQKDGKKRIFYKTPDSTFVYGLLFDSAGNDVTTADMAKLTGAITQGTPKAESSKTPALSNAALAGAQQAFNSNYIKEGKGKVVYVVFDPNCPVCKALHQKSKDYLGTAEIRWIPVGILTAGIGDSQKKAVALLRNGKPALDNLQKLDVAGLEPRGDELVKLQQNLKVLEAAGSNKVPTIIWESGMVVGMPGNQKLDEIFGK